MCVCECVVYMYVCVCVHILQVHLECKKYTPCWCHFQTNMHIEAVGLVIQSYNGESRPGTFYHMNDINIYLGVEPSWRFWCGWIWFHLMEGNPVRDLLCSYEHSTVPNCKDRRWWSVNRGRKISCSCFVEISSPQRFFLLKSTPIIEAMLHIIKKAHWKGSAWKEMGLTDGN